MLKKQTQLLVGAVVVAWCSVSAAQSSTGFSVNRYEPAEISSEWFFNDTLDFRGQARPAAGLTVDWANEPLTYTADDGSEGALIRNQVVTHWAATIALWERLRFGVSLPVTVYQEGDEAVLDGTTYSVSSAAAVGDVRIGADVRLVGAYRSPFSLAAGMRVWLPTGKQSAYAGDGAARLGGHLIAAGELGPFVYSARLGATYRTEDPSLPGDAIASELPFGVAAGVRLLDESLVLGPELYGSTGVGDGRFFDEASTPLELLMGAHYTTSSLRLGIGAGPGLTSGLGSPKVRTLLSIAYVAQVPVDSDRDGIVDKKDRCPHEPGVHSDDPALMGCPRDTDADGFPDARDACPHEPGVANSDTAKNGCPAVQDRDQDEVMDAQDACPDVAGIKSTVPGENGCPPVIDADDDGIADDEDACPTEPGSASDDPQKHGCPTVKDRDGDGINDDVDACPDEAGSASEDATRNGCSKAIIQGDQVKINETIEFELGSAEILEQSSGLLADVARVVAALPEGSKVRVEGHTDGVGSAARNQALSQQRAEAVVRWLVDKGGLAQERLLALGFGPSKPLVPNTTEENRKKNRRVEFHIEEGK